MTKMVKVEASQKPNEKVTASPAKAFFVQMITRDIELQDAILDLLDNCVDGIRRSGKKTGPKPYKGFYAHITLSEDAFVIEDNCGGIPLDVAKKYAFMMGGSPARASKEGMIGVYGIGMKRAIFKMGRSCVVHSHTAGDTFEVEITKEWLADDKKWDLEARHTTTDLQYHGTRITVTDLHETIRQDFADGSPFRKRFAVVVRDAFSLLLEKGFNVTVNTELITPKLPTLLWKKFEEDRSAKAEELRPYLYTGEIDGVKIFLAVGFRERPETATDSDAEPHYSSEDAGWTIICNDRAVLSYDRTQQTGWGWGGVPSYHTQFIAITGFVIFEGHPLQLPMTTTKRGVDANSPLYTVVRERMQEGIRQFTRFTNEWKGLDLPIDFEDADSVSLPEIQRRAEKGVVRMAPLNKGKGVQKHSLPNLPKRPKASTMSRISYSRPVKDVQAVSLFLFDESNTPASEVGAEAFDFVYRMASES